jgi:hypothetical protein
VSRDPEKQTALAKWEAAFEKRTQDGSMRPVQFVQVAILKFSPAGEIELLEEYWHSTAKTAQFEGAPPKKLKTGSSEGELSLLPTLSADCNTDTVSTEQILPQQPPAVQISATTCNVCGVEFGSRNRFFKHLREDGCAQAEGAAPPRHPLASP